MPEDIEDEEDVGIEFDNDLASEPTSIEDYAEYADEPGSASFAMKRGKRGIINEVEQAKIILREVAREEIGDLDELARYFLGMVTTIKMFKMSQQIKQNRINFFATLR